MRLLLALASFSLSWLLVLSLALFAVTWNGLGRTFLHDQTERLAARLMGSGYVAELGRQSIGLSADGNIEVTWRNIRLGREGAAIAASEVERLTIGISPLDLAEGRMAVRSIAMSGATIDLTRAATSRGTPAPAGAAPPAETASAARPPIARVMDRAFRAADRAFADLVRSGIERVDISGITLIAPVAPGGGPFVSRIERAAFDNPAGAPTRFEASLGIDDLVLTASGDATFDAERQRLAELHVSLGPLDIAKVAPPGPPEDRLDTRPFASDAKISAHLDLSTGAGAKAGIGPRELALTLAMGAGAVQVGKGHTRVETATLAASYREGDDRLALQPSLLVFDDLSLQLAGALTPPAEPTEDLAFRLSARDVRSGVGRAGGAGAEPQKAEAGIEGTIAFSPLRITLSKAIVDAGSGRIDGGGEIGLGSPDALTRIRLGSEGMSVEDVKAFWPFNLAPSTRRWVMEHLSGEGSVRNVLFALDLTRARLTHVFKPKEHPAPEEMRLGFDFAGIGLSTVGQLPKLNGAAGSLQTLGGDTTVRLDTTKVEGFDTIVASPSTATFVRAPKGLRHDIDLTLSLALAGRIDELLAVAARPPIDALRSLDLKPEEAGGKSVVDARIAFKLGDHVPKGKELQSYAVDLQLDGVDLAKPVSGRRLSNLSGPVSVVPGAAEGDLKGEIDGVPATIRFGQPFGPAPAVERRLGVELALDGDRLGRLVPALAGIVEGTIDARIAAKPGDKAGYSASVDLRDASLALPVIGWRKGKGVASDLAFDIRASDGEVELAGLTLKGDGFSASGTVVADGEGLRSARLEDVSFNPGDEVDLTVGRAVNGFSIELTGRRFDARPFLADLRASLGERAAARGSKKARQLDVAVALDRVTGFGGEELRDLQLNYAGSSGSVAALSVAGTDGGGGRFSADVSPRGEERSIKVRADDAGRLADFGGLYGRMEGGALALTLLGSSDDGYAGTLAAEAFTLVDEPRLSSLVGSAPVRGSASLSQAVGAPLRTERATFDHASASVAYDKNGLRVRDGIIRGPVFGSSFSGTIYDAKNRIDITGSFMPAYGLNGMFGKIPIVGQILGNGNEGGLIGITYRLEGAFASPKLTVNPISAIAPGIFRSIFAYGP